MIILVYGAIVLSLIGASVYFFASGQPWVGGAFLLMAALTRLSSRTDADEPKTQADAEQVVADSVTREKARLWDKLEAMMQSDGGVVEVTIAHSDGGLYWVNADGPWETIERSSPTLAGAVIGAHYELTKEGDA